MFWPSYLDRGDVDRGDVDARIEGLLGVWEKKKTA